MMVSLLQLASITIFTFVWASPCKWTWLGGNVVCDLAITTCMILSLRPSNSHFSSNKSTLVKLTRLTIETGLVTSVAALLELILGVVSISKLYANCLLASLNFRLVLRSQSGSEPDSHRLGRHGVERIIKTTRFPTIACHAIRGAGRIRRRMNSLRGLGYSAI
ncbi:hypothetical protein EV363DRAFT_1335571, partial [Boletus edulis]